MFNDYILIRMDQKYIVGKRHCVHPFVILEGGAVLIFNELLGIAGDAFHFDTFCDDFSRKYRTPLDIIIDKPLTLCALADAKTGCA